MIMMMIVTMIKIIVLVMIIMIFNMTTVMIAMTMKGVHWLQRAQDETNVELTLTQPMMMMSWWQRNDDNENDDSNDDDVSHEYDAVAAANDENDGGDDLLPRDFSGQKKSFGISCKKWKRCYLYLYDDFNVSFDNCAYCDV